MQVIQPVEILSNVDLQHMHRRVLFSHENHRCPGNALSSLPVRRAWDRCTLLLPSDCTADPGIASADRTSGRTATFIGGCLGSDGQHLGHNPRALPASPSVAGPRPLSKRPEQVTSPVLYAHTIESTCRARLADCCHTISLTACGYCATSTCFRDTVG